ncbi:MAG: sugar ABC transporter substrate-binding protein [Rhodospirillum sp.]|nr:sugar ABC transporter substrate-binding protein [Rhodospirillum sp.]
MRRAKQLLTALITAAVMTLAATSAMADGAKIFVIGGKADDPFWSKVKRGADDAGLLVKEQGGSVTWLGPQNYDNLGPDAAKLIRTALSQNPDAIVAPDWVPEAQDDALKAVVDAGVPLIIYNAGGIEAADRLGAKNYIGNDEYVAGVAGGEYFGSHGAKKVLCVNTLPGAANTEARCKGIAEGIAKHGGASQQLPLPSTSFGNPTAVAQAIKAALLKDSAIDGAITISAGDANSAAIAISQGGAADKVKLASFDMDEATLKRIKDGSQLFAIDQQPYLQGYLAVSLLNGLVNFGLDLPTKPVLTGPGIVSAENVDATLTGAAAGVR